MPGPTGKRTRNTNFRRPAKRRKMTVARLNKKVNRLIKDEELKFLDTSIADVLVSAGGTFTGSLAIIAAGTDESTRIGREIRIKKIFLRLRMELPAKIDQANAPEGDIVRVILHIDKQTNGTQGGLTSLLENTDYQSFRNLNNGKRYRILSDTTHYMNSTQMTQDGTNTSSHGEMVMELPHVNLTGLDIPIDYASTSGALTQNTENSLNILLISHNGVAAIFGECRIRFTG